MEINCILEKIKECNLSECYEIEDVLEERIDDIKAATRIPVDKIGDLYTIEEFLDLTRKHLISSYDGFGLYATETEQSRLCFSFSSLNVEEICEKYGFTHIKWYNK